MKKFLCDGRNALLFALLIMSLLNCKKDDDSSADCNITESDVTRTALVVTNNSTESVFVGVILADIGGACGTSNPPATADQLAQMGFCGDVLAGSNPPYAGKCSFMLAAGASKTFPNIPATCISGNVTFGGYAACPDGTFPDGYTTAEFTLNVTSGDEGIDVSLVNGYNYKVTMAMTGGGAWSTGAQAGDPQPISLITPNTIGNNIGNPGVYPRNCTDCIQLVGSIVCPGFPADPTCQATRICNAQRDVSVNGGTVTIALQP